MQTSYSVAVVVRYIVHINIIRDGQTPLFFSPVLCTLGRLCVYQNSWVHKTRDGRQGSQFPVALQKYDFFPSLLLKRRPSMPVSQRRNWEELGKQVRRSPSLSFSLSQSVSVWSPKRDRTRTHTHPSPLTCQMMVPHDDKCHSLQLCAVQITDYHFNLSHFSCDKQSNMFQSGNLYIWIYELSFGHWGSIRHANRRM